MAFYEHGEIKSFSGLKFWYKGFLIHIMRFFAGAQNDKKKGS